MVDACFLFPNSLKMSCPGVSRWDERKFKFNCCISFDLCISSAYCWKDFRLLLVFSHYFPFLWYGCVFLWVFFFSLLLSFPLALCISFKWLADIVHVDLWSLPTLSDSFCSSFVFNIVVNEFWIMASSPHLKEDKWSKPQCFWMFLLGFKY